MLQLGHALCWACPQLEQNFAPGGFSDLQFQHFIVSLLWRIVALTGSACHVLHIALLAQALSCSSSSASVSSSSPNHSSLRRRSCPMYADNKNEFSAGSSSSKMASSNCNTVASFGLNFDHSALNVVIVLLISVRRPGYSPRQFDRVPHPLPRARNRARMSRGNLVQCLQPQHDFLIAGTSPVRLCLPRLLPQIRRWHHLSRRPLSQRARDGLLSCSGACQFFRIGKNSARSAGFVLKPNNWVTCSTAGQS